MEKVPAEMRRKTYSWRESRKALEVYSRSREVLDSSSASLLGLEKAKAVPWADLGFAPISAKEVCQTGDWMGGTHS